MPRIPLRSGFTLIPEGYHVFRIYDVTYDEAFGKLEIHLVNAKGLTMKERYSIKDANDELNEKSLNAFSYFARNAMGDFDMEDIDPYDLINHYILAEVVHTELPSRNDPSKTVKFANLGGKSPAEGFTETPTERALTLGTKAVTNTATASNPSKTGSQNATGGLDLDSLLGG